MKARVNDIELKMNFSCCETSQEGYEFYKFTYRPDSPSQTVFDNNMALTPFDELDIPFKVELPQIHFKSEDKDD